MGRIATESSNYIKSVILCSLFFLSSFFQWQAITMATSDSTDKATTVMWLKHYEHPNTKYKRCKRNCLHFIVPLFFLWLSLTQLTIPFIPFISLYAYVYFAQPITLVLSAVDGSAEWLLHQKPNVRTVLLNGVAFQFRMYCPIREKKKREKKFKRMLNKESSFSHTNDEQNKMTFLWWHKVWIK